MRSQYASISPLQPKALDRDVPSVPTEGAHSPCLAGVAETVYEALRSKPTAYLIAEDEEAEGPMDLLGASWTEVFQAMLENWLNDPAKWPQDRTFAMFEEWFEVEVCESVHDLVLDEPLEGI